MLATVNAAPPVVVVRVVDVLVVVVAVEAVVVVAAFPYTFSKHCWIAPPAYCEVEAFTSSATFP